MNHTAPSLSLRKTCNAFGNELPVLLDFPSEKYLVNHIVACVVNVILIFTTVTLNALTILTFWKSSQLRQRVCYFLIMLQSFIDFAVGIINGPLYTIFLIFQIRGIENCIFHFIRGRFSMLLTALSITILTSMNLERYLGIVYPLIHRNKVTKKRVLNCFLVPCFLYFVLCGVSFVNTNPFKFVLIGNFFLFLPTTVYIYIRIFFASAFPRGPAVQVDVLPQNTSVLRRHLKEIKLAKSCSFVIICAFVCFVPATVAGAINLSYFEQIALNTWCITLAHLNSSLNSIIFFWRDRFLRSEAKKIFQST